MQLWRKGLQSNELSWLLTNTAWLHIPCEGCQTCGGNNFKPLVHEYFYEIYTWSQLVNYKSSFECCAWILVPRFGFKSFWSKKGALGFRGKRVCSERCGLWQVPVDYSWANEILDHELPHMVKQLKSESESGTVSKSNPFAPILLKPGSDCSLSAAEEKIT